MRRPAASCRDRSEQLTELIGRVPLKDIVRETTDVIERLCIEAALNLTGDNRASAAEMLGLSRQSLYVKLRRFGLADSPRAARAKASESAQMSPPRLATVLELLKPITWFPPMWAFGCGVVSSGVPEGQRWPAVAAGVLLAGPMVCGTSQAVNDWFDRHVDAINEPNRPIPSGRMPGRWGLYIAIGWTGAVAAGRHRARALGASARRCRAGAGLGLQRAAVPAQAQRLVGQRGGRGFATRACPGSPAPP